METNIKRLLYTNTEKRDKNYWLAHAAELSVLASLAYSNAELAQTLGITTTELKELKKDPIIKKAIKQDQHGIINFYNQKLMELASGATTKTAKIKYNLGANGGLENGAVEIITKQNAPDLDALNILLNRTTGEMPEEKKIIIETVEPTYKRNWEDLEERFIE